MIKEMKFFNLSAFATIALAVSAAPTSNKELAYVEPRKILNSSGNEPTLPVFPLGRIHPFSQSAASLARDAMKKSIKPVAKVADAPREAAAKALPAVEDVVVREVGNSDKSEKSKKNSKVVKAKKSEAAVAVVLTNDISGAAATVPAVAATDATDATNAVAATAASPGDAFADVTSQETEGEEILMPWRVRKHAVPTPPSPDVPDSS